MSADEQEVETFLRNGATLAAKVSGGVIGAGVGGLIAGPPGALIGAAVAPFLEHQLSRLAGEFVSRQLGERQRARAGAGALLLTAAVQRHLSEGRKIRDDDFQQPDETGRRPMDEVAEHAIMAMISAVDERRLPYLSNFYAALYFDESISRASIATLVAIADSLNFRSMCILNIVGRRALYTGNEREEGEVSAWPALDHLVAKEIYGLIEASVLVSKSDEKNHHATVLGYLDVEPGILQLGSIGRLLFDKMELGAMSMDQPDLVETESSLRRIAASSAETWELDGGAVWDTKDW